jgi:lauroyl/myristoyl acyltransferase
MDLKKIQSQPAALRLTKDDHKTPPVKAELATTKKTEPKDVYTNRRENVSRESFGNDAVPRKKATIAKLLEGTKRVIQQLRNGEIKPRPLVSDEEMEAFSDGISHG